jgi:hypothetical protein
VVVDAADRAGGLLGEESSGSYSFEKVLEAGRNAPVIVLRLGADSVARTIHEFMSISG